MHFHAVVPAPYTLQDEDVRVRRAKLTLEAVGPKKRYAQTRSTFAIKITNTGDSTAHDVAAVAALPAAAEYVRSTNAGVYDEQRGRVRWSIGSLRPGAHQVVEGFVHNDTFIAFCELESTFAGPQLEVDGFGDIEVDQQGRSTLLSFAEGTIELRQFDANLIDASDFVFV